MNNKESDILRALMMKSFVNQRILAEDSGHSVGVVNKTLKELLKKEYLNEKFELTLKAIEKLRKSVPRNAIILAAGYGMRMIPVNMEIPKALLEVNGEFLIERIIKQLHEVGVKEIHIVVGYMKERFEYLIDKYSINLIVNNEYATKNNLFSLKLALRYLNNSYIIPSDIYCINNPFNTHELYSWYMVGNQLDYNSNIKVNRKRELVRCKFPEAGNLLIGVSYVSKDDSNLLTNNVLELCNQDNMKDAFWESALWDKNLKCPISLKARIVINNEIIEINTYEQLRELDNKSRQLKNKAIMAITKALNVSFDDITDINVLKKGMTNRSFVFRCKGKKYIMRIPGEGTDKLIDRQKEVEIYNALLNKGICENIVYIDAENGFKITEYINNVRVCNPNDNEDLKKCMYKLKMFHELSIEVNYNFDIYKMIDFYEALWDGEESAYSDYYDTKNNIKSLKVFVEKHIDKMVLTHIDAVPDNFLFSSKSDDSENVVLIDWEYAAMQDPHVDIAMFCIYSLYSKEQIDNLIDIYFDKKCPFLVRIKIYCYIAMCGLLWSNWCEYKSKLGIEFGEYSLRQYRFAKDYYRIARKELKKVGVNV